MAASVRRPHRFSKEVYALAKQDILEVMKKCQFASDVQDDEWDDLFTCVQNSTEDDGYHLMKRLEDNKCIEGSLQDAEELDAISEILRRNHEQVTKDWVRVNGIAIPYSIGDVVKFRHGGVIMTGKVHKIDAEMARLTVEAEGRRGKPIVCVEDVEKE